jgi:hypothetical protein
MFFSSLEYNKKKKIKFCVKGRRNGLEIQDGRQTRICQNSVILSESIKIFEFERFIQYIIL